MEKRETTAFGGERVGDVTGLDGATLPSEFSAKKGQKREKEEGMEGIYGTMIEVNRRE